MELESELNKARKQERAYEEAMEQLQADLDSLEQDYARLKASAANATERPGMNIIRLFRVREASHSFRVAHGVQPLEGIEPPQVEGSLETTHLLEQVTNSLLLSYPPADIFRSDRVITRSSEVPSIRELIS